MTDTTRNRGGRPRQSGPADLDGSLVAAIERLQPVSAGQLAEDLDTPRTTMHRALARLEDERRIHRRGIGRATRWRMGPPPAEAPPAAAPVRARRAAWHARASGNTGTTRSVDPPWAAPRDGFTAAMEQRQQSLAQSSTSAGYLPHGHKVHR